MKDPILTEELITKYFSEDRVIYSSHATGEMDAEELGEIIDAEVFEATLTAEIIMRYPEDKPYPSVLVLGFTIQGRPIHFTCALDEEIDKLIIITVYEPKPDLWVNYRKRIRR